MQDVHKFEEEKLIKIDWNTPSEYWIKINADSYRFGFVGYIVRDNQAEIMFNRKHIGDCVIFWLPNVCLFGKHVVNNPEELSQD